MSLYTVDELIVRWVDDAKRIARNESYLQFGWAFASERIRCALELAQSTSRLDDAPIELRLFAAWNDEEWRIRAEGWAREHPAEAARIEEAPCPF